MKKYLFYFGIAAVGIGLMSLLIFGEVKAQEEPADDGKAAEQEPVEKEKQKDKAKKGVMFHLEPFIV
ncbi:uncharacterized protein METZ01_LOCUS477300, partial [marine metagenome]